MLDRKLKAIQADDEKIWLKWAFRAYETTYGYEFQGDNLLIARINLLVTFCDYLEARWNRKATDAELGKLSTILAWNIWQMDGLKETVPIGIPKERDIQLSLIEDDEEEEISVACTIYNWTAKKEEEYVEKKANAIVDQNASLGDMENLAFATTIFEPTDIPLKKLMTILAIIPHTVTAANAC